MSKQQQNTRGGSSRRPAGYAGRDGMAGRGMAATRPQGRTRLVVAAVLGVVLLVGAIVLLAVAMKPAPVYAARYVADQGREHIAVGQSHPPYNTVPPTSGWHYATPADWGVYEQPVADEYLVHNLEHGGIVIQYWCPDGCADTVASLRAVAERYPKKVILAPYARPLEQRIALTAWRWLDTFDEFDEARVVDFIAKHIDQGPEKVME